MASHTARGGKARTHPAFDTYPRGTSRNTMSVKKRMKPRTPQAVSRALWLSVV